MKTALAALAATILALLPVLTAQAQDRPQDRAQAPEIILECGQLLDIPGQPPRGPSSVIVRDGRIVGVVDGYLSDARDLAPAGPGARRIIDLRDWFVMPGLIDCHTHITGQYSGDVRLRRVTESDADAAIDGVVYAERTLMAGFTTIRNVGSAGDAALALRDAIASGKVPGPRILEAGQAISATGGHGDSTLGYRDDLFDAPGPAQGVGDGADGARRAVRAQVKRGADLIKLTATGGVLSNTASGVEQQFFDDELAAIVQTARLLGRRVAAHAHGATGIKAALRAGVDSIEHGTYLDDEAIALFRQTGAYLVPTIHAGKFVAAKAQEPGYFPPPVAAKAAAVGPVIQAATGRAYRAGVKIAFGTDVGVGEHGTNAEEFIFMRDAGIPEEACLQAATRSAADLCGLADRVGTIEAGKLADIVAVRSSPLRTIEVMRDVGFVMKEGTVYKLNGEPVR